MVLLKPPRKFICAICGKEFSEANIVLLGGVYYCLFHPRVLKEWARRLLTLGNKKKDVLLPNRKERIC